MAFESWLLYAAIVAVTTLSPGPAVVLALRNGISHGVAAVMTSTLGNALGLFCLAGLSVLGLAAIMAASSWVFEGVKLVGAAYLIYLGVSQFSDHRNVFARADREHSRQTTGRVGPQCEQQPRTYRYLFAEGALLALTNPKAILFFGAIFPQFVDVAAGSVIAQYAILVFTMLLFSISALMIYGIGGSAIRRHLHRGNRMRWFNRIVGSLFVGFGLGLLVSSLARR